MQVPFQGTVGKAAELGLKDRRQSLCDMKWDAAMEQNPGLTQTGLLLSFLPWVPSLRHNSCQFNFAAPLDFDF